MATTQIPGGDEVIPGIDDVHAQAHENRDKQYVLIALVLAALTGIEVLTYAIPGAFGGKDSWTLILALMVLMATKFWIVGWYFMHLKFDKRTLTGVFYSGIILAALIYLAVLSSFRFFAAPETHVVPAPQ